MKILVIRFSSIGDIVLTTPIVRCIKQQLPGSEVHYLTKKAFGQMLEGNPYINKIITIDEHSGGLGKTMKELEKEHYDFIADLHKNLRSLRVLFCLRRPFGTFSKLNIRKWILTRFKINLLPDAHIVDRYFRSVRKLGVRSDGRGLDYFIRDENELRSGLSASQMKPSLPYTVLVVGARHPTKQMPADLLIQLCRELKNVVVLVGGAEDMKTAAMITSSCPGIIDACGRLNINQSALLIKDSACVITHDTGMMHIAAAFSKEILSVWGNTVPEFGMSPYFPRDHSGNSLIFQVEGLSCRPCSKLGYQRCPRKHFRCMTDQDIPAIAAAANLF